MLILACHKLILSASTSLLPPRNILMRNTDCLLLVLLVGLSLALTSGCGSSNEATVAPRTAEQVEAYKAQVYAAEEEDDAAAAELEAAGKGKVE